MATSITRFTVVDWTAIVDELKLFNKAQRTLESWGLLNQDTAFYTLKKNRELIDQFANRDPPTDPTSAQAVYGQWIRTNFSKSKYRDLEDINWDILDVFVNLHKALERGQPELLPQLIDTAIKHVAEYARLTNTFLLQVAPAHFMYDRFKIWNPHRLPEYKLKPVLDYLPFVVALFHRRGMKSALHQGIKLIIIQNKFLGTNATGHYFPKKRWLSLVAPGDHLSGSSRHLVSVTLETLLHEFGHHLFDLLSPDAQARWNADWDPVHTTVQQDQDRRTLTQADRLRYWDILRNGTDLMQSVSQLNIIDRWRIYAWLRSKGYIDRNKRILNRKGKVLSRFLADPEAEAHAYYMNVTGNQADGDQLAVALGILHSRFEGSLDLHLPLPVTISVKDAFELAGRGKTERALEVDKLHVPKDYARTDPEEDFAETFVVFMMAPERLHPIALHRMKRVLSLSGLYGKPVKVAAMRPRRHALPHLPRAR